MGKVPIHENLGHLRFRKEVRVHLGKNFQNSVKNSTNKECISMAEALKVAGEMRRKIMGF